MNQFEALANDVIFCVFEYIDDVHLFRAFYGLNARLNHLLFDRCRFAHFDFRSISYQHFNTICQKCLPSIIDRTVSLHLSDADDTPDQINIFLSSIPSLNEFTQLKSLSLSNVQNPYIINQILQPLHNLTCLDLSAIWVSFDLTYALPLLDTIWSLPHLISCQLRNILPHEIFHSAPTRSSSSLQYLIIHDLNRTFAELAHLYQFTPTLHHLEISIWDLHLSDYIPSQFHSLSRLKLSFQSSLQMLINILKLTPHLEYLTIRIHRLLINGDQWEQIITDDLPKLRQLRFLMESDRLLDETIDPFFQTFQTKFWLEDHQWFVQYHCNQTRCFFFYTLPYPFKEFLCQNYLQLQSSCPEDQLHHRMFDRVDRLWFELNLTKQISLHPSWRFFNIRSLHLYFPFHEHLWSILPTMNSLLTLTIEGLTNPQGYSQLQTLFDRSPNLHCLIVKCPRISLKRFFQLHCSSIVQFDFVQCEQYLTKKQCHDFLHSSFSSRCEILRIRIKKSSDILQLVTKLPSLHTLIIPSEDLQLIDWLSTRLPSTSVNQRDSTIRIWCDTNPLTRSKSHCIF